VLFFVAKALELIVIYNW